MAPITALPVRDAPRAIAGRGRGNRDRVLLSVGDALAPGLEGIASAEEAAAQFGRIIDMATVGNRMAVLNLASTGQARAIRSAAEFREMVAGIEGPEAA
jgi:hypothetical protein